MNGSSDKKYKQSGFINKRVLFIIVTMIAIAACVWGVSVLVKSLGADNPPSTSGIETLPTLSEEQTSFSTPVEDTTTDTTAVSVEQPKQNDGVYTFLIIGMDHTNALTDVLMVALFDTVNNKLNVLSIPRDTYSNLEPKGDKYHINLAYSNRGIEGLKVEIMNLIGYVPNYFVKVNLSGFVRIVNKIGGVWFDVPQDMDKEDPTQDLYIHLKAGYQHLNGDKALQLMRYREYYNSDIGRVQVRQKFLAALASQLLSTANLANAVELAGTLSDNVDTDLTNEDLVWFAKQAISLDTGDIRFDLLPGNGVSTSPYWYPYKNALLDTINNYYNPFNFTIININIIECEINKED